MTKTLRIHINTNLDLSDSLFWAFEFWIICGSYEGQCSLMFEEYSLPKLDLPSSAAARIESVVFPDEKKNEIWQTGMLKHNPVV